MKSQFWHDHYKFDNLINTVLRMLLSCTPSPMCPITHVEARYVQLVHVTCTH